MGMAMEMQFNVNKTEEVVFSCKKRKPFHPHLLLGNDEVERKSEHKDLGMQLDFELNFLSKRLLARLEGA